MTTNNGWSSWEKTVEAGPAPLAWRLLKWGVVVALVLGVMGLGLWACGFIGGAADNAMRVAKKEFYPDALLRKYEWFKDASAQLDKKRADIRVYDGRLTRLSASYNGVPRKDWPRDDREQLGIWESEEAGVKASFNSLAAEYNAQMVKFNWRFTNVGDLPPGAAEPLPREVKPYVEQ